MKKNKWRLPFKRAIQKKNPFVAKMATWKPRYKVKFTSREIDDSMK